MKKLLAAGCALMLVVVSVAQTPPPSSAAKMSDHYVTVADSLRMYASLVAGTKPSSPLWVCLPQLAHTGESYEQLIQAAITRPRSDTLGDPFPNVLVLDLRGHGKSVAKGKETLSFQNLSPVEFAKYPTDVEQVIQAVTADTSLKLRKDDITVIGASVGANTAALLTQTMPAIKRLVLLSPGMNFRGLEPATALQKFGGQILLVSSKDDKYSFETVSKVQELNPNHTTLLIFKGDKHGTEIINNDPEAMKAVVDWLMKK